MKTKVKQEVNGALSEGERAGFRGINRVWCGADLSQKRGSREIWELTNDTKSMPHPMHLHGFRFRVIDRRKSTPQVRRLARDAAGRSAQDLGWLDTVLVWPGERVRIAIDFSQPFEGVQRYMFHCHNLEHEDQGMMLNVAVEP